MSKFSLIGKTAIVTGGASGIGKAISKIFAEQGAKVHILDINKEGATQTANEIRKANQKAIAHCCDVSNQKNVNEIIKKITTTDAINILVNNAGIAHIGSIEKTREEDLDRLYNVNIKGVYNCTKACIESFKKNGGGVILNLASVASSVGHSDRFAYSMTKGAVLTMTYSIAKDYVADNIRCNCISPGRVHTPFVDGYLAENYPGKEKEMFKKLSKTQPIGRMGKPEEIANLSLFLCSNEAEFITGTDYPIDGGRIKLSE
tara:strand:- start:1019 stop:1798 length:780 start_codon:yes stop_codon:yes gene_type:complete